MTDTYEANPGGVAAPAEARERFGYVDTSLGQIHYCEVGAGQPVLLLHQTASGWVMYRKLMPILARAGYRAIAMDTPGFGQSASLPGLPDMESYGQAAAELLEGLGVERAHVVGVRTGASVAVELAARHPERVDRLVVCALVALRSDEERAAVAGKPRRYAWEPDGRGEFVRSGPVLDWVRHFAHEDDGDQYLWELIGALQSGPRYWQAYDAVVAHDAYARLAEIRSPILFLNPLHDGQFELMQAAHGAVPGSQYVEMEGIEPDQAGKAAVVAIYPERFAELVTGFLRG